MAAIWRRGCIPLLANGKLLTGNIGSLYEQQTYIYISK
jgi:hypothetical protein